MHLCDTETKRLFSKIWSEIGTIKTDIRLQVWAQPAVSKDSHIRRAIFLLFVTTPGLIILIMICLGRVVAKKLLKLN